MFWSTFKRACCKKVVTNRTTTIHLFLLCCKTKRKANIFFSCHKHIKGNGLLESLARHVRYWGSFVYFVILSSNFADAEYAFQHFGIEKKIEFEDRVNVINILLSRNGLPRTKIWSRYIYMYIVLITYLFPTHTHVLVHLLYGNRPLYLFFDHRLLLMLKKCHERVACPFISQMIYVGGYHVSSKLHVSTVTSHRFSQRNVDRGGLCGFSHDFMPNVRCSWMD